MSNASAESKLIQALNKIEQDFEVETLVFEGIYIWPLLKIKLYFDNWAKINNESKKSFKTSFSRRIVAIIKSGLKFLFFDFKHHTLFKKADVLIFADPFNRRITVDGRKYEIYTDSINDYFLNNNYQTLVVERNSTSDYPTPRYSNSTPQVLLQLLFLPYLFLRPDLGRKFDSLISQIEAQLKSEGFSTTALSAKSISKFLRVFNMHHRMYLFLIKRVQPKAVFLTEWYSIVSMACISAAKKLNLDVVELQHGVQTSSHIAYGNFTKNNPKFINPFPSFFWVWSKEDESNVLEQFSRFGSKPFNGGHVFLNEFKASKVNLDGQEIFDNFCKKINKPICLVTIQPTYELHQQIVSFVNRHSNEYFFMFRLHPTMLDQSQEIKALIKANCPDASYEVDHATKVPLFLILKVTKLHVTYNSSTVLEASQFKVPSIIFDNDLAPEYFKPQILSGLCQVADQNSEIIPFAKDKNISSMEHKNILELLRGFGFKAS